MNQSTSILTYNFLRQVKIQIQIIILMSRQLTEFLLWITFQRNEALLKTTKTSLSQTQEVSLASGEIIDRIYSTINEEKNYKAEKDFKSSVYNQETAPQGSQKCNCKKSKCLKLYCECFAKGSLCKDCGCQGCQNSDQFSYIRALAIDESIGKVNSSYGSRTTSSKGCNCKKSECLKKYCECYSQGLSCGPECKCQSCKN